MAHAIIKSEKFQNLPSARWRNRKAVNIIKPKFKGLRAKGDGVVNHNPRAGEKGD